MLMIWQLSSLLLRIVYIVTRRLTINLVLAVQRKVLESQQRNLQAEIECLKSFQKRN